MNKTKIDWCDMTWNPITGCYHGCEYCYAVRIADRFGRAGAPGAKKGAVHVLEAAGAFGPYPYGFSPTFHRYRLAGPARVREPQRIFVGSMADMFGAWVPDEWIEQVIAACAGAPWHSYMFLTKSPGRYQGAIEYIEGERSPVSSLGLSASFGASATNEAQLYAAYDSLADWICFEPLLEDITAALEECRMHYRRPGGTEAPRWSWAVIGAETGSRRGKTAPNRKWIEGIAGMLGDWGTPIYMKRNLADVWGEPLIQEFP